MKYICLGYIEPKKFETMTESERNAMVDECWAYDDELRAKVHFAGGEALQPPQAATTLHWKNGKVSITGPTRKRSNSSAASSSLRRAIWIRQSSRCRNIPV